MTERPTEPSRLEEQGWRRRFIADPARTEEAVECYTRMGFEVLVETVTPEDLGPRCQTCSSPLCPSYKMIYTRLESSDTPGKGTPE